ncbi:NAD(P)H-binding protein [Bacillus sp. FJAT-27245]|uniref:NAD(P)H-binding protein n=1 Tax=Bacillus sp. FJAT-27245 TaxID=1684144 RepID=UPI0006A79666|nr:NAD(P)H-binding protein [Bacillus sp. FJAT-27245]
MRVLVIGTEDLTGEHVVKLLAEKQHEPVALAGSENQEEGLKKLGASEVIKTDDNYFSVAFKNCDAVIYLGGASPRTGESKPILIDHQLVLVSIKSAKEHGVKRFLLLSALRDHETDTSGSGTTGAKQMPEELLRQEGLTYTIIRPSEPVDKPGKGKVEVAETFATEKGEIPKEDLASVLVEVLETEHVFNKTITVTSGETPIQQALTEL